MTDRAHTGRPEPRAPADSFTPGPPPLGLLRSDRRSGSAPVIHYFGRTFTSPELDTLSTALAARLQELGARPGDRIAVQMQNVPYFPISVFGIWRAGCVLVPMNPMLLRREIAHQLKDSGARIMLCAESCYEEVAAAAPECAALQHVVTASELDHIADDAVPDIVASARHACVPGTTDLGELLAGAEGLAVSRSAPQLDDPAVLMYTSGTTGAPKAAVISHRNLAFSVEVKRRWFALSESDIVLGIAPLFHITGLVAQLLLSMSASAPIVLGYRFEPLTLLRLIERYRPTFSIGAITAYLALLDHPARQEHDLSSLTKVFTGGAPVSPAAAERFERAFGCRIHNTYGLTETTAATHLTPLGARGPVDPKTGSLSIGVPVYQTMAQIVDDEGHPTPDGELGEIVVKGPQVSAGYWQRPDETTAAFRPEGFHTGDIGFRDAEGWFYVVDRRKDVIIASGFKVWPREVEDVLYEHPAVREAAVIGVPDEYRGETVKAVLVLHAGAVANSAELIEFCRKRLAAYKIPRTVEFRDELPKTLSGKILKRQLRDEHVRASSGRDVLGT
jgi:long-chain acyl-CoA synthetase